MNNKAGAKIAAVFGGLAVVIALAQCGLRLGNAMPQTVHGDDVLSVAFGDAKETISRAMVHKADSYFHGGVEIDCDHHEDCDGIGCAHEHHKHPDHEAHPEVDDFDHEDHEGHDHEVQHDGDEHSDSLSDPWLWINSRIRAPEVDRHLDNEKAVELMPWFWGAVKADPHNVDAWTTAIFIASTAMKDEALTQNVLKEAKSKNPDSSEIMLAEAKLLYKKGKGDVAGAEKVFLQLRDKALSRCNGDTEQLEENDRWMYKFALDYLKDIEKKRKAEK